MVGTRGPSGEINTSKTTRPLCLSSCLVIPGGYRTNGLFQVISRAASPFPSREGPSLSLPLSLSPCPSFVLASQSRARTYAMRRRFLSPVPIDDRRRMDIFLISRYLSRRFTFTLYDWPLIHGNVVVGVGGASREGKLQQSSQSSAPFTIATRRYGVS